MAKGSFHTVYKITNTINNMIYIGAHTTHNPNDKYMGSGLYIGRALKKYGVEVFKKEILFLCETKEEMFQKEYDIVNEEFIRRNDTYNIVLGGRGHFNIEKSLETKKRRGTGKLLAYRAWETKRKNGMVDEIVKKRKKTIEENNSLICGDDHHFSNAKSGTMVIKEKNLKAHKTKLKNGTYKEIGRKAAITRKKNKSLNGYKNGSAKKYLLFAPNGQIIGSYGNLKYICKKYNISLKRIKNNINKPKISFKVRSNATIQTLNSCGWEIKEVENG